MICPNCQASNSEKARFCMNCGKPLLRVCANCSAENPAEASFCQNCGQPLKAQAKSPAPEEVRGAGAAPALEFSGPVTPPAAASTSVEGERRVMTILFCDVAGSTALAESMDPEEWTDI